MDLRPELGFSGQIWAILLEIRQICLDLGHFAQIWAILLGFGLFGRIWVRKGPKGDKALRMGQGDEQTDGRTYGPISPVFYRTSSPLGPLPKNRLEFKNITDRRTYPPTREGEESRVCD